jgi:hypothetical protein
VKSRWELHSQVHITCRVNMRLCSWAALRFSRLSNSSLFFSSNARVLLYSEIEMALCGAHVVRTGRGEEVTESHDGAFEHIMVAVTRKTRLIWCPIVPLAERQQERRNVFDPFWGSTLQRCAPSHAWDGAHDFLPFTAIRVSGFRLPPEVRW